MSELSPEAEQNTNQIRDYFQNDLKNIKFEGLFGIANFSTVFQNLMLVQQNLLKKILEPQFEAFLQNGSIISLAIAYPPGIINCIDQQTTGKMNKVRWNLYADEYRHLNHLLKQIANEIAGKFNGIAISPITGIPKDQIATVSDYFPHTISHRIVAEYAGIGWRGKNELIITNKYGPAIRFASILINVPLIQGHKIESKCGDCTMCLDVCSFLKNKGKVADYRESCRKYILSLGLKYDVCGKCIKACYNRFGLH